MSRPVLRGVLVLVLLATLSFEECRGGTSCTTPNDDHGNCPETATALSENDVKFGTFIAGNIEAAGDVDYFSFQVRTEDLGQFYIIQTTIPQSDPLSDTFVRLIDKDQVTQLASDDNSGEGNGSKILWAPDESGTFYVEVSQLLPDDTGLYSVSVFRAGPAPEDDHADTPEEGTLLVVNDPPVSGTMELSGDVDYFQFVAVPNRFYDIETSNLSTGSDTVISLLDRDLRTVLATDDQGGREFNASRILWVAPSDIRTPTNLFAVRVSQFLEGKYGVGYSISVSTTGVPAGLPLDGSPTSGYLDSPGDVDAYLFSATKDYTTRVDLSTLNNINNFRLKLIDVDGISVLTEQKNLDYEDLVYEHIESGTFYLFVTEPYLGKGYALAATATAPAPSPDLNGDGEIDAKDFIILMKAYHEDDSAR